MVRLRLARAGAKRKPIYRIVATDSRSPRDGRFIEHIGQYDPNHDPARVSVQLDRYDYWVGQGAQPSDTVSRLVEKSRAASA